MKLKNILLMSFLGLFLVACAQPADVGPVGPDADGEATPVTLIEGGEVVFAQWATPPSLDPHRANDTVSTEATSQIFEGLVDFNADGEIEGMLATEFFQVDPYIWQFNLRRGVEFHDGTPFNADAVKMSIDRLLDPEEASVRAFILAMVEEVIVVDNYTVQFVTPFPFSPLPAHLAHAAGFIIAPSAIERELAGGLEVHEHPIGTGPFVFYEHIPGEVLIMVRNENYWGDLPGIERLRFWAVPEATQRFNLLTTGEANVIIASAADVAEIEANPNLSLIRVYSTRQNYVGFNTQTPPFNDVRVRQAIAMIIDLDAIVYTVQGMGIPAVGPLSPQVFGAPTGLSYPQGTLEDARALLAEAGFPDGFTTTIGVGAGRPIEEGLTAQIVQANLAEIGITATINEMEWGAFLNHTEVGEHEIFVLGWTVVTGDADYGVFPVFHSNYWGGSGNRTFYYNPIVDALLEQARMEIDPDVRIALYQEISEILVYEVPLISTFYPTFAIGTHGIEGLFVNFNATPFFRGVSLTQ